MAVYYNENDPFAAQWLREMIKLGELPGGDVDERSITAVSGDDLRGYVHCHFFAGIGGWAYAARLAGWPLDRPLWTGSCPCQPWSAAGKLRGADDPRHLWPDFFRLIRAARPPVVVGEQVALAAGYEWIDGVCADLEGEGYAFRAVDVPACAVDAPHIRNRLYWVSLADARGGRRGGRAPEPQRQAQERAADEGDHEGVLGLGRGAGLEGHARHDVGPFGPATPTDGAGRPVALPEHGRREGWDSEGGGAGAAHPSDDEHRSFWADAQWITCHDGQARRVQPDTPLLVHGIPGRVGLWRGFGNAIVPSLAAEVLRALMETT